MINTVSLPSQAVRATVEAGEPDSPLVYRSILDVPFGNTIIPQVRRVTSQWLTRKKFDRAPLETGTHHLDAHTVLTSQALYHPDGTEQALRIQLREDRPEATWRVTITAMSPAREDERQSVAVTLECFENGTARLSPARPALVEQLVTALRPRAGLARLTLQAQQVTTVGVDALVDILCDPDRRIPAIVAARPSQPDGIWSRRLRQLMPKCAGDAALYLLTDAEAVHTFREAVGAHHHVAPGALRTFLPDVDPAWSADAPRHRILSGARIRDPKDQAFRLITRYVHQHALEAQVPARLRDLAFPDVQQRKQEERRAAQDTAARTHPAADEHAALKEENVLLNQLLAEGDRDLSEAGQRELLAERTIKALQQQVHRLTEQYHQEMEEHLFTLEGAEQAQNESRVLRQRLYAQGRAEDTIVPDQTAAQPASFDELWERLGELDRVLVTADRRIVLGLDDHELARIWAAKAWQALRSLDSYATAQNDGLVSSGYYDFCRNASVPGARIFPIKQIAMGETEATRSAWGDERIFNVPAEVHPSCRIEMGAHLKLGTKGRVSPRLHFYDDSCGPTSSVIVGYIGPHLTNKKT
ncbi:hypothetical protein [Streptomyces anulatus]|uniref:hypothetical protein n=1 Tax=Streptomyces anulatus TaxID=1892 RepID=UPI001D192220|nr:hypothetical protein [Streptomyces anulatus]